MCDESECVSRGEIERRWVGSCETRQSQQVCRQTREREEGQDREREPDPAEEDPGLSPRSGQGQDQRHPQPSRGAEEQEAGAEEDPSTSQDFKPNKFQESQAED